MKCRPDGAVRGRRMRLKTAMSVKASDRGKPVTQHTSVHLAPALKECDRGWVRNEAAPADVVSLW